MSRSNSLRYDGDPTEGVIYGETHNDGSTFVYCGNCGNRIKIHDITESFCKSCFNCGCVVTNNGTISTKNDADPYGLWG